jgi:hypothetical protein
VNAAFPVGGGGGGAGGAGGGVVVGFETLTLRLAVAVRF